jgi:hypothetical protein
VLDVDVEIRGGVRCCRFSGEIGDDSLVACLRRVWTGAGYDPGVPEIYDFRKVGGNLSSAAVRAVARLNQELHPHAPPVRVAFLVDHDLGFGLARMYQPYVHDDRGENIGVFRDEAQALVWVRSLGTGRPSGL